MAIKIGALALAGSSILAAAAYGVKTVVANRRFITSQHIFAELVGIGCALTMGSYVFRKGVIQLQENSEKNVKNFTKPFSIVGDVVQNTAAMFVTALPIFRHFLQAETPVLLKSGVSLGLIAGSAAVVYYVNYSPAKAGVKDDVSAFKIINTLIKCGNIYILYLAAFRQKQLDNVIAGALIVASVASMIISSPISKDILFRWLRLTKQAEFEITDEEE